MKNILTCLFLLILSCGTMGQKSDPSPVLTKEGYLLKSRNQLRAALVIAGVGSAMILVGGAVGLDDVGGIMDAGDKNNSNLSGILIYGGIAIAAVSVPFFISSNKNKKKAGRLSIQPQAGISIKNGTLVDRTVPSLNLRMKL